MEHKIFNADGVQVAGDAVLDGGVKQAAILFGGWVEDDKGNVVYISPERRAALKTEEQ